LRRGIESRDGGIEGRDGGIESRDGGIGGRVASAMVIFSAGLLLSFWFGLLFRSPKRSARVRVSADSTVGGCVCRCVEDVGAAVHSGGSEVSRSPDGGCPEPWLWRT
jgi:hypothetical protein